MDDGQVAGVGGEIQNSQNAIPRHSSLPASHPVPPLTLLCSFAISRFLSDSASCWSHPGKQTIAAQSSLVSAGFPRHRFHPRTSQMDPFPGYLFPELPICTVSRLCMLWSQWPWHFSCYSVYQQSGHQHQVTKTSHPDDFLCDSLCSGFTCPQITSMFPWCI